jgi:hypothetical protein
MSNIKILELAQNDSDQVNDLTDAELSAVYGGNSMQAKLADLSQAGLESLAEAMGSRIQSKAQAHQNHGAIGSKKRQ